MYRKGDFHLHTTASDGKLSPKELVSLGKNQGLDIIAITDHDNTFGR
jgi:Predicted metal-dependent phosphoesterases (PHP family)